MKIILGQFWTRLIPKLGDLNSAEAWPNAPYVMEVNTDLQLRIGICA